MERILRQKLSGGIFKNVDQTRSRTMSRIRSKGNKTTEDRLRLAFVRAGLSGWTLHRREIFGTPDFYFPTKKVAIFVDGCFWHGCLQCGHIPKTRTEFWKAKFKRNQQRSNSVKRALSRDGIQVLRLWEHELENLEVAVRRVTYLLKHGHRKLISRKRN